MTTSTWSVRAVAGDPAETPVEALFRAHAQELGRYLVAMVRDRSLGKTVTLSR